MPRVSISLPEDLMKRLEPVKEKLNISQVCREALERRVAMFERSASKEGQETGRQEVVMRLRDERASLETRWEDLGRRNAAVWLGTASYEELKDAVEANGAKNGHKSSLPKSAFKMLKRDMKEDRGDADGGEAQVYKTAWLDCVKDVWLEVNQEPAAEVAAAPADNGDSSLGSIVAAGGPGRPS